MKLNTFGNINNPVMIMLSGFFCPSKSMENIYNKLKDEFYIIAPDYTGHYEGGEIFTTREQEARKMKEYLIENNITNIQMIYGQSMGTEI